eukprot:scaffold242870_cov27-Tisochrysis_lutea.AAC.1
MQESPRVARGEFCFPRSHSSGAIHRPSPRRSASSPPASPHTRKPPLFPPFPRRGQPTRAGLSASLLLHPPETRALEPPPRRLQPPSPSACIV